MLESHDENTILGYLEGELGDAERTAFEALMAQDEPLRQLVGELLRDREMLRAVPAEEAPPYLMERVTEALEREMLLAPPAAAPRVLRFPVWARWSGAMAAMLLLSAGLIWQYDPFGWHKPAEIIIAAGDPTPPLISDSAFGTKDGETHPGGVKDAGTKEGGTTTSIVGKQTTPGSNGNEGTQTDVALGAAGAAGAGQRTGKGTIALAMAEAAHLRKATDRSESQHTGAGVEETDAHGARTQGIDGLVAFQIELQSASPVAMRELLVAWADNNDAGESRELMKKMEARRHASSEAPQQGGNRDTFREHEKAAIDETKRTGDDETQPHPTDSFDKTAPGAPAKSAVTPGTAKDVAKSAPAEPAPGPSDPAPTRGSSVPRENADAPKPKSTANAKNPAPAPASPAPAAPRSPEPKADGADKADPRQPADDAKSQPTRAKPDAKGGAATSSIKPDAVASATRARSDSADALASSERSLKNNADEKVMLAESFKAKLQARQELSLLVPEDKLDSLVQHIEKRTGQSLVVVRAADGAYLLSPQIANQRARALVEEADAGGADAGNDPNKDADKKALVDRHAAALEPVASAPAAPALPVAPTSPATPIPVPATPTPAPAPAPAPPPAVKPPADPTPSDPAATVPAPVIAAPAAPAKAADLDPARQEAKKEKAQAKQLRRVLVRIVIVEEEQK